MMGLCTLLLAVSVFAHAQAAAESLLNERVRVAGSSFQVVTIDLQQADLRLQWLNPDTDKPFADIGQLKTWADTHDRQLVFATNAGIYDHAQRPLGLHVENGKTRVPLNTVRGDPEHGNFSIRPNGVFAIDTQGQAHVMTTRQWQQQAPDAQWATQSGPMLVIDGAINPHFNAESTSIKWRSGVCAPDPSHVIFAITEMPVNFHTFAQLFRDELHCDNALYLDGTLSQIYVNGTRYGAPTFMLKPWVGIWTVFADRTDTAG